MSTQLNLNENKIRKILQMTSTENSSEFFSKLWKLLNKEGISSHVQAKFESFTDNNQRLSFVQKLLEKYNLITDSKNCKLNKDIKRSDDARNSGNELYKNRRFTEALEMYNRRYKKI
jgi:hypothetical protein